MKHKFSHFSPPPPLKHLIAHRGISARAPENTLVSFELAAKEKVKWIEFDVQLTSDQTFVIFHDDDLHRTSNGQGYLFEKDSAYLSTLDAGAWFDVKFVGEKIPVFANMLDRLAKLGLFLNIELKLPAHPPQGHEALFSILFSKTLESIWPSHLPKPLLSSFNWNLLESVRSALPLYPIGYLSESCSEEIIDKVAHTRNASLHCAYRSLTPEMMSYANSKSVPVIAYTVNDPIVAARLIRNGIFGIISDDPTQLAKEIPSVL